MINEKVIKVYWGRKVEHLDQRINRDDMTPTI